MGVKRMRIFKRPTFENEQNAYTYAGVDIEFVKVIIWDVSVAIIYPFTCIGNSFAKQGAYKNTGSDVDHYQSIVWGVCLHYVWCW